MPACDVIVLDASLRQSLAAVRSLGRRGLAVAAVDVTAAPPAFRSRWCSERCICPAAIGTSGYAAYVERLAARLNARVLIPSHDGTIAALRRHGAGAGGCVKLALAGDRALSLSINKAATLAVAAGLGVRIPRGVTIETVADVAGAVDAVGLPAVVKPTESWLRRADEATWIGAELVTSVDEARRAVARISRHGGVSLIQTLLTGRREAVSFIYAHGEFYARFGQWAKRMNPPLGGESVLRQSIEIPDDIGRPAERLVRELNLEGYSEVEFRRDSSGVPHLMEINSRLSASVDLAIRCGVDFPYLLHQWAAGRRLEHVREYRIGRWMRYLQGDFTTTMAALAQRGRPGVDHPARVLAGFGASFLRPMRYDYVDGSDPLPAIKAFADFSAGLARSSAAAAARRIRAALTRTTSRTTSCDTTP
jgi:predicted ATP-grasp superfamily ATP-dependent carboligase